MEILEPGTWFSYCQNVRGKGKKDKEEGDGEAGGQRRMPYHFNRMEIIQSKNLFKGRIDDMIGIKRK